ncbi:putative F-box protein At1g50870 [Eutrema salsugineum]|uniref:putative F-box protein At1g50870 n=1 Tax=Eutrema salsugineum TaxID=72664 RepID=UPI000CED6BAA|nr:putative F-box protein At1g50870 [Eutrema salsugineum]
MSNSTSWFSLGLISDILLRLPPKSIVRSRCVSKLWSSITTDPYFTNSFETRSLVRPSLLMFFIKKDKLFVFSFPQHNQNANELQSSSSHQQVDSYHMKYPKNCRFSLTESVHGLICFQTCSQPILWNPSMKQFVTLPKPNKTWKDINVYLGYDPIEGKHKVVCRPRGETSDACRVLTLGSAKRSWRTIKTNQKHRTKKCNGGWQCINGVLYYAASVNDDSDVGGIVMSFDVRTEKFDRINLPSDSLGDWFMLIPFEGKLACLNAMANDGITLWILEDAKKHKWSRKHFLTPFARSLNKIYRIDGITDAGELICVPITFLRSFFILYFDPVRNSLRRVEFKGIADDAFRFSNGLGNKRLGDNHPSWLYTFPNHIDTLLSL